MQDIVYFSLKLQLSFKILKKRNNFLKSVGNNLLIANIIQQCIIFIFFISNVLFLNFIEAKNLIILFINFWHLKGFCQANLRHPEKFFTWMYFFEFYFHKTDFTKEMKQIFFSLSQSNNHTYLVNALIFFLKTQTTCKLSML